MNHLFPIVVAGLPRCGSSLTMQMLDAAGVPVVGEFPAYEPDGIEGQITPEFLEAHPNAAFKFLDPHLKRLPVGPRYRFIFLTRSRRQQALSQMKMLRLMGMLQGSVTDAQMQMHEESLANEERKSLDMVRQHEGLTVVVRFEDIIARTESAVFRIADLLRLDSAAQERMRACVKPRSVSMFPGMLEVALMAEARQRKEAAQAESHHERCPDCGADVPTIFEHVDGCPQDETPNTPEA